LSLGSPTGRSYVSVRLSRRAAWNTLFAVCAVAVIACASVWGGKKFFGKPPGSIGTKYALQPGPWGEITAQPILIEAPASLISPNFQLCDGRWYFAARTPDDVAKFLGDAGLTSEQIARLVPNLQQVPSVDGLLSVAPPEDLVRSLSEDVRSRLYDKLAAIPQNFAQVEPFILSTTEDMLAFYPNSESIRLAYFRLKNP
ncbi:MAG: hypothetical protein ACKOAL_13590, partial [Chthoniobacterales bacterium]